MPVLKRQPPVQREAGQCSYVLIVLANGLYVLIALLFTEVFLFCDVVHCATRPKRIMLLHETVRLSTEQDDAPLSFAKV